MSTTTIIILNGKTYLISEEQVKLFEHIFSTLIPVDYELNKAHEILEMRTSEVRKEQAKLRQVMEEKEVEFIIEEDDEEDEEEEDQFEEDEEEEEDQFFVDSDSEDDEEEDNEAYQNFTIEDMKGLLKQTGNKKITIKNNISQLRRIKEILKIEFISLHEFNKVDSVISEICKIIYTPRTKMNLFLMIKKVYTMTGIECPDKYFKIIGTLKSQHDSNYTTKASIKELPLLQYLQKNEQAIREDLVEKIKNNFPLDVMKLALFDCYINMPSLRKDWSNVQVTTTDFTDKKTNYLNITTSKLCLNSFKNQDDIRLPNMIVYLNKYPIVLDSINSWIKRHPMKHLKTYPLFLNSRENPLEGGSMDNLLHKIFGKKISCNVLRKYYIMMNCYYKEITPEKMIETCRVMCHSPSTSLKIYAKSFKE
jgi:hypothetical protein